jgi:hypothetical protein
MKKITLLFLLFVSSILYSQTNGITYQALLLDPAGEKVPGVNNANAPLANKDICLRFTIVDAAFKTEYQETITIKTDEFGMVNTLIGSGRQSAGYASSFSDIYWDVNNKSLKVAVDVNGQCATFIEISDQPLTYVPFAFSAKNAENVTGVVSVENGGTNAITVLGAKTNLGLENVDNTRDLDKPIGTATQLGLNLKENLLNKSIDVTIDGASETKYPTVKAVKTYVDASSSLGASALALEISRAIATESTIAGNLATETKRAELAEGLNATAIAAEKVRAETAEEILTNNLGAEAKTRAAADEVLTDAVAIELGRASKAEGTLTNDLSNEISRATNAEVVLATNLAEAIADRVAANLLKEDKSNKSISISADGGSDIKYPSVKSVKDYVDASSSNGSEALNAEISRALTEEKSIAANLAIETKRARLAETANADAVVSNTKAIEANATAILGEATTSRAAELANADAIVFTTAAIKANASAILDEAATSRVAELANANAIVSNTTAIKANVAAIILNTAAINSNARAILDEAATARATENSLTIAMASETTTREVADLDLTTDLDLKANLTSPTFTGTPTLPTGAIGVTQTAGDSTTSLATTAFVSDAITTASSNFVDLTTNQTILGNKSFSSNLSVNGITNLMNTNSSSLNVLGNSNFGGNITNGGQITSTAFIKTGGTSSQFLKANGTVDANTYATQTALNLKANLVSPTFTGIPVAPTAEIGTKTTQLATTAFVNDAVTGKFVDLTTSQIITGKKTFNSDIDIKGVLNVTGVVSSTLSLENIVSETGTWGADQWQSFTATESGRLDKISVFGNGLIGARTGTLTIYRGTGTSGSKIYSGATELPPSSGLFDLTIGSDVNLVTGQVYTFRLEDQNQVSLPGGMTASTNNKYTQGNYYSTAYGADSNYDLNFKLWVGALNGGNVNAISFVKSGGTSSQFLKADGSVDSNTYLTTSAADEANTSKEDSANKSSDSTLADVTNTKFPTQLAVKTYVDASSSLGGSALALEISRAIATEVTLADKLATETKRAELAERLNATAINANAAAISDEAATARAAELANADAIVSNTAAIKANASAILDEAATARATELANADAIVSNTTLIITNATAISANEDTIVQNTAAINANATAISDEAATARAAELANADAIVSNVAVIKANVTAISANADAIVLNTEAINANATAILDEAATGRAAELANAGAIVFNTAAINTNATAISANADAIVLNTEAINANATAILDEAATARAAELANARAIVFHTAAINTNATAISANADTIVQNTAAININATAIFDEAATARSAEDSLAIALASETTKREDTNSALTTALNLKANLVSPVFIGTPTATTADIGTSTTQIATTAFVNSAASSSKFVDLTTDQTIAGNKHLNNDLNVLGHTTLSSLEVAGEANFSNASFFGRNFDVNSNAYFNKDISNFGKITSSSFIKNEGLSSQFLKADGSVDENKYATQTDLDLKAPLVSPNLTGTPTSPTADPETSTTQIATTAFVNAAASSSKFVDLTTDQTIAGKKTFTADIFTSNDLMVAGDIKLANNLLVYRNVETSGAFIKVNGLGTQFLKADGSVDSNSYLTTSASATALGDLTSLTTTAKSNLVAAINEIEEGKSNFVDLTTTQNIEGAKTFSSDLSVNGITVGRGSGDIATNTTVGSGANGSNSTGTYNTAIGAGALGINSTGSNNTALGTNAGQKDRMGRYVSNLNTSVFIGAETKSFGHPDYENNQIVIGYRAEGKGSNTIQLGNDQITAVNTNGSINSSGTITSVNLNTKSANIGSSEAEPSAVLSLSSSSQGFLPPRMIETQRIAISNPALGLVVYQVNNKDGLYFYNGTTWVYIIKQNGSSSEYLMADGSVSSKFKPTAAIADLHGITADLSGTVIYIPSADYVVVIEPELPNGFNCVIINAMQSAYTIDMVQYPMFYSTQFKGVSNFTIEAGGTVHINVITVDNQKRYYISGDISEDISSPSTDVADKFEAINGQTSFALTQSPSVNSKVKMYINGIRLSNSAYSWNSETLTYNPDNNEGYQIAEGDRIQFDYYTESILVNQN